jgi:hypothetical protein
MDPYLIAEMQTFGGDHVRNVTWGSESLGGQYVDQSVFATRCRKLKEDGCALGLAPRREHVERQVVFVVFPLLYCPRKTLTERHVLSIVLVWAPVHGSTNAMR